MPIFKCFKNKIKPGTVIIDDSGDMKQYIYCKKKLIIVPYDNTSNKNGSVSIKQSNRENRSASITRRTSITNYSPSVDKSVSIKKYSPSVNIPIKNMTMI